MQRVLLAGFALVVGASVGALALPARGSAHADFDFSLPSDGATVAQQISEITVGFTEEVTLVGNGFEVLDAGGQGVLPTPITDDDKVFRLILDVPIAGGPVGVWYEVTSIDGHVISGAFSFTVDAPIPPTTTEPSTTTVPATTLAPSTVPTTTPAPTSSTADAVTTIPADGGTADDSGLYIAIALAVAAGAAVFVAVRSRSTR